MNNPFTATQIFIVDDTAFMRAGLSKILVELGCSKNKIFEFENGLEALNALQNMIPNLIFIDWNMPIMTGLEFIKRVRSSGTQTQNVPIVFVTTVSEKEKIIEALPYGLSGYILKPVSQAIVDKTIRRAVGEEIDDE